MTTYHDNLVTPLRDASFRAPACVGYMNGKGWYVYSATEGCPEEGIPELFCAAQGRMPIALNDDGRAALDSLFQSALSWQLELKK